MRPDIGTARKSHTVRNLAVGISGIALTAAGIGVAMNSGHGTGPNPTENPGGIVEPSNSPVPIPFSTESPTIEIPSATPSVEPTVTPTPIPTETPKPIVANSSEKQIGQVEAGLQDWLQGKTKVPTSELWKFNGTPQPLNMVTIDMQKKDEDYWQPEFSTYYLQPLVIGGHLISPLLQIDGKGHRYYIMTNSGPINGTHDVSFNIYPQHDMINTATPFEYVPDKDALKMLEKEKGKIIVMSFLIDKKAKLSDLTTESGDPNEIFNSQEVNKQFADFSVLASKGDAQKILDSGAFPLISAIVNKPLDAKSIKNPSQIPYCVIYSR